MRQEYEYKFVRLGEGFQIVKREARKSYLLQLGIMAILLLLAVFTLSACASKTKGVEEARNGPPCPVRRVLVVRNNYLVDVEIVESRTGSGSRMVIAYGRPGVQEIAIKNDYQYTYSARPVGGGTTITATSRSRASDRAVSLSRECRE